MFTYKLISACCLWCCLLRLIKHERRCSVCGVKGVLGGRGDDSTGDQEYSDKGDGIREDRVEEEGEGEGEGEGDKQYSQHLLNTTHTHTLILRCKLPQRCR